MTSNKTSDAQYKDFTQALIVAAAQLPLGSCPELELMLQETVEILVSDPEAADAFASAMSLALLRNSEVQLNHSLLGMLAVSLDIPVVWQVPICHQTRLYCSAWLCLPAYRSELIGGIAKDCGLLSPEC